MRNRAFLWLAWILFLGVSTSTAYSQSSDNYHSQWVEWIADIELSYARIDNLNRSAFSSDTEDDKQIRVDLSFGRVYQLRSTTRLYLAGTLSGETYKDFDGMDNLGAGLDLGLRHKFGVGPNKPYVQVNLEYSDNSFDVTEWDNSTLTGSVELGKNVSPRLSLAASFSATEMNGSSGPTVVPGLSSSPFDQDFWHASLLADYRLARNWLVTLSYTRREGDFHSACTVENVGIVLQQVKVEAITADRIFGGCVYKTDGSNNSYALNLGYAISGHSGLNLYLSTFDGRAKSLDYSGGSLQLGYHYRY